MSRNRSVAKSDDVLLAGSDDEVVETVIAETPKLPARSLVEIVCNAADGSRLVLSKGDVLPEDQLDGLTEGKHYTRGEIKKVRTFTRNGPRKALMLIVGNDEDGARKEFVPGDDLPLSQQTGLKAGIHFE